MSQETKVLWAFAALCLAMLFAGWILEAEDAQKWSRQYVPRTTSQPQCVRLCP